MRPLIAGRRAGSIKPNRGHIRQRQRARFGVAAFTRIDLQEHLLEIWGWYRPTMFLVTHDIDEVLVLADRVVVFGGQPGTIEAEITVDLPRPRDRTDLAFHAFQDRAMKELGRSSRDRPDRVRPPGRPPGPPTRDPG